MKRSVINHAQKKSLRSKYLAKGGAHRFRVFQQWLLREDIDSALHAFLSLFAFDGLRIEDYSAAINNHPYLYGEDKVGLSWQTKVGRTERIWLSPITSSLIFECGWEEVQKFTLDELEDIYSNVAGNVQTLEQFKIDQLAWFSENASGPIFEHFSGRIPMTALPDTCYVRLLTQQVVKSAGVEPTTRLRKLKKMMYMYTI